MSFGPDFGAKHRKKLASGESATQYPPCCEYPDPIGVHVYRVCAAQANKKWKGKPYCDVHHAIVSKENA